MLIHQWMFATTLSISRRFIAVCIKLSTVRNPVHCLILRSHDIFRPIPLLPSIFFSIISCSSRYLAPRIMCPRYAIFLFFIVVSISRSLSIRFKTSPLSLSLSMVSWGFYDRSISQRPLSCSLWALSMSSPPRRTEAPTRRSLSQILLSDWDQSLHW